MASRYIGFRNEAEILRSKFPKRIQTIFFFRVLAAYCLFAGSLKISQEHVKKLEAKLDANEKALKEAESRALAADSLQIKLEAAEKALKEAEDKASASEEKVTRLTTREADIVNKLDALSNSFGSKPKILFCDYCLFLFHCTYAYFCVCCSRKTRREILSGGRSARRSSSGLSDCVGVELQVGAEWPGICTPGF